MKTSIVILILCNKQYCYVVAVLVTV